MDDEEFLSLVRTVIFEEGPALFEIQLTCRFDADTNRIEVILMDHSLIFGKRVFSVEKSAEESLQEAVWRAIYAYRDIVANRLKDIFIIE